MKAKREHECAQSFNQKKQQSSEAAARACSNLAFVCKGDENEARKHDDDDCVGMMTLAYYQITDTSLLFKPIFTESASRVTND